MSDRLDRGDKNDETSTDIDASFSCADCGQEFKSRQELKNMKAHSIKSNNFYKNE
jgi:hypothetical protein